MLEILETLERHEIWKTDIGRTLGDTQVGDILPEPYGGRLIKTSAPSQV